MPHWKTDFQALPVGKGRIIRDGKDLAIISIGHPGNVALEACNQLAVKGIEAALYDIRFLKPIDEELLHKVFKQHKRIITLEDGTIIGGLGTAVTEFANDNGYHNAEIHRLGIPDRFVEHGTLEELHHECGIDLDGILKAVNLVMEK
jgi:1-deoxy-D-xylulose-5-phosphate synthase